ncbi:Carboxypeptidase B2 [Schistosoma japonicum]|nr:Carboxypeptidase B2 [Schistosoma japonicum]
MHRMTIILNIIIIMIIKRIMMMLILLIGLILLKNISTSHIHYYNFKVLRMQISDRKVINTINSFSIEEPEHYDIWMLPRHQNTSMYISVSPAGFQNLTNYLKSLNISFEITINNLQKAILDEKRENHLRRMSSYLRTGRQKPYYKSFNEIIQYLDQLSQMHSHLTVENFGFTAEGRPMKGVKISTDSTKPIIWIDAGIHAREWIAPATALSIINKLMRPSGQALLKHFQFFIVPVVNPDGYEYTRSKYRLWRKNRAQTEGEVCIGTDLNRNFPFKWGVGNGASPHSCSETYRGSVAASELETQSIIKKLNILQKQIILYLSLHSFGQYILTPFGFSRYNYPPYYQKLMSMGKKVKQMIQNRHGYVYQVGSSSELLYEAAGATDDYVTGELKIPYAYTIELCDEGRYGFLLPPSYIGQVGRQLWTALTVLANDILPT